MAADAPTEFKLAWYRSPEAGRLAILTIDNGQDYRRPTTLDERALASLDAALDEIASQRDAKGVLVTGKPFVFCAGADLEAFTGMTPERARQAARRGHDVFGRLRDLPQTTLAAINGACLGGGLELALHCDYRTVSTAAAPIGFPEVFLSILPAWGGTQLLPRLTGAQAALQVIVGDALNNNRLLKARQLAERGITDRLLNSVDFFEQSLRLLEGLITGSEQIDRSVPPAEGLDEAIAAARKAADDRVHGATRAPYVAIDLIAFAAGGGDLAEGLRREEDALAELLPGDHAQAAVYSFGLTQQRVKHQPGRPDAKPRPVRRAGIVGSGLMGAQLGALFLRRLEVPLVMRDVDIEVLGQARQHIDGEIDQRVSRGRLDAGKASFLKDRVSYTTSDADLAGCDLVIEAVSERLDLKKQIFGAVEAVVDEGCVLATNTSSLSVSAMAEGLAHPERVAGLHFFNPPSVLPLVEVARAEHTSDETFATVLDVATRLGKSAVACADAPAFVVNRLLTRFTNACGAAVNAGCDFAEVDDAVKALGLPMGPFELLSLVGPAVAAHVAATLHEAFGERFPLDRNFQMIADTGLPGVYDWSKGRVPYDEIARRWRVDAATEQPTPDQIRQSALEAVADEAHRMLADGVVADARDIDTCMLLGAGWPFFLGGVCKHLDQTGISHKLFGASLIDEQDRAFE